ncbi:MAG: hypothetical protein C0395_10010 [Gemmatimonas sp.]|nr:hypothetical protein [Gemmatimonas sp.]
MPARRAGHGARRARRARDPRPLLSRRAPRSDRRAVSGAVAHDGAGVAGRLVVGLLGPALLPAEAAWLRRHRPAGVILFGRNVRDAAQLRGLCDDLRRALPAGAEIMADQEGGAVSVLAAAAGRPPSAWTLGAIDDPELTRRVHRATAQRARDCGLDRLLAPCADVLLAPGNTVIGSRAFGSSSGLVARHVAAAVRGLREGGVRCCLKHWPGHGAVARDTHLGAATPVPFRDERPYAAGLAAGAEAIMLGHLVAPGEASPASLSLPAATRARRLGAGLLLSDDITMGALRSPLAALGVTAPGDGLADRATWRLRGSPPSTPAPATGCCAGGSPGGPCRSTAWNRPPASRRRRPIDATPRRIPPGAKRAAAPPRPAWTRGRARWRCGSPRPTTAGVRRTGRPCARPAGEGGA